MVHYADGQPTGELTLRTLAMPSDANAAGDIFGGWVMAQMDLACGIRAAERAKGRVVTAAVKEMSFAKPMKIGDTLCVYTHVDAGRAHLDDAQGRGLGAALPDRPDGEGDRRRFHHGGAGRRRPAEAGAGRVAARAALYSLCSIRRSVPMSPRHRSRDRLQSP